MKILSAMVFLKFSLLLSALIHSAIAQSKCSSGFLCITMYNELTIAGNASVFTPTNHLASKSNLVETDEWSRIYREV